MACSHLSPGFPTVTNCALSIWSGHPRGEPGLVQRLVGPWLFQIIKMIDMGGVQHGTTEDTDKIWQKNTNNTWFVASTHSPHRGQVMSFLRRHIGEWTFASWRSCLTHMIPAQCCSMIRGWVKTYNTPVLGWTSMKPSYFSSCIITVIPQSLVVPNNLMACSRCAHKRSMMCKCPIVSYCII